MTISRINTKEILLMLIISAVILIFSGCSEAVFGDDALLRPPRPTGDKAEIQEIIAEQAGGNYSLKYPQSGSNRSAVIMKENEDDVEYAVAFYSTETDSRINVCIMTFENGKWKCSGTFSNSGTGVDRVLFEDLNGDDKDELLIGWTTYNPDQKTLTAYSIVSEGAYEMVVDETYTEMLVSDITADSIDDIILLSVGNQKKASSAVLLQYSEQEKRPISKYAIELDSDVKEFKNILIGNIDNGQNGIVIDGEKSDDLMSSQIIYYDKRLNELVNPLLSQADNGIFSNPTTRKDHILSKDSDEDGMIEVPVLTQLPAMQGHLVSELCSITSWKQLSIKSGLLLTKMTTVINYNDGYYFLMPDEWKNGSVTALKNTDKRQITFYVWNSKASSIGDKLLTIHRYTAKEWESVKTDSLILLEDVKEKGSNTVFAAEIFKTASDDSLNLKEEDVISLIRPIG